MRCIRTLRRSRHSRHTLLAMNPSDDPSHVEEEYKKLLKARRMAKRTRTNAACIPCKERKVKCNDSRPCSRCNLYARACISDSQSDLQCNNTIYSRRSSITNTQFTANIPIAASSSMFAAESDLIRNVDEQHLLFVDLKRRRPSAGTYLQVIILLFTE